MKNFKSVAIGFVAGAMCMTSISAMAMYSDITAKNFNDVTFVFDGERTASPSDQPVLNYNNYTYVPLRYVAETMGAEVFWDPAKKTIDVKSKVKEVTKEVQVEKIVYVEKGENPDSASYSYLPITKKSGDQVVEFLNFYRDTAAQYTRINISVENKGSSPIQLIVDSAKLTVDGKDIDVYPIVSEWDTSWGSSDILEKEEKEGHLVFKLIDENYEKMVLTLDVKDSQGNISTYTFYAKR